VGHRQGEQALHVGIELDDAGAAEMGMGDDPAQGQGEAIERVGRINNVDGLGKGIDPRNRGSLLGES
jgi:hypothetical protein